MEIQGKTRKQRGKFSNMASYLFSFFRCCSDGNLPFCAVTLGSLTATISDKNVYNIYIHIHTYIHTHTG